MSQIITGLFLSVVGVAMIFFARSNEGETSRVYRSTFIGDLYVVAAIAFMVMGLCFAGLGLI
jgi:drug/metabolite transporter (DMT)-like permease